MNKTVWEMVMIVSKDSLNLMASHILLMWEALSNVKFIKSAAFAITQLMLESQGKFVH